MSLTLIKSGNLETKAQGAAFNNRVDIGEYEVDLDDFCQLVIYVLENSDFISQDDPRYILISKIREGYFAKGYNPDLTRFRMP